MNWSCPNQINGHCEKLEKPCHPVQEGCVLEGKVKVIGKEKKPAPPLNTGESDYLSAAPLVMLSFLLQISNAWSMEPSW